ncbi:toprim domain-containing protein [Stutzerimonas kunmingensis]|uniref:toprim domain-containing protein n=1 Tax=Stutzerimonas kunmingensis TaxID=1211807 RepID=UPI000CE38AAD|nr:toprim domain-containing protein [Stutzerimonas kunmingensis]MBF6615149.1 toprim domain-containing protein [Candidimonas sp.]
MRIKPTPPKTEKKPTLARSSFASLAPAIAFLNEMQFVFGPLDWTPIPDRVIHRFDVPGDRPSSKNGWYVLFPGEIWGGAFGSWKADISRTWSSRHPASTVEKYVMDQQFQALRRQQAALRHERHSQASIKARELWKSSSGASSDHPYLVLKGCESHILRVKDSVLLVPLFSEGTLMNLQRIYVQHNCPEENRKLFLKGGKVEGCYSPIGSLQTDRPVYICEGWATGATIHEETGSPVACAMNAGNLLAVAKQLRRRYPSIEIILAGDDDRESKHNRGRTDATRAADELKCSVVFPAWPEGSPLHLTDFNDLRQWLRARA